MPFLAFMDSFNMAGEPVFSDDDHRVTFPVSVAPAKFDKRRECDIVRKVPVVAEKYPF